ncbi:thiamine phosphate synthase [Candidatus Omnitrophota bacterium]
MRPRKKSLAGSALYAVVDKKTLGGVSFFTAAKKLKRAGVSILQLRDKQSARRDVIFEARRLKALLKKRSLFIINDYLDIARITDADGIHLGQDDLPIELARKILGPDKLIGISCHSLKQAKQAEIEGADYISIGPVYRTPTKPQYKAVGIRTLRMVARSIKIPVFAIGGINQKNIDKILSAGARRVAVCRLACKKNIPVKDLKQLSKVIAKYN